MSNRAAKLILIEPLIVADRMRRQDPYPRHFVLWGVLAFCLSSWAVVILAVTRLA
jgi:hypothetical protein